MASRRRVRIFEYQPKYLADLTNLMSQWEDERAFSEEQVRDNLEQVLERSDSRVYVAEIAGRGVGYAQTTVNYYLGQPPHVEIVQLLVDREHRGIGVGTALLGWIEREYAVEGWKSFRLHSRIERSRAHVLYERQDYRLFKVSKFFQKRLP